MDTTAFRTLASRLTVTNLCIQEDVVWHRVSELPDSDAPAISELDPDVHWHTLAVSQGRIHRVKGRPQRSGPSDDILNASNALTSLGLDYAFSRSFSWDRANTFLQNKGRCIQHLRLDFSSLIMSSAYYERYCRDSGTVMGRTPTSFPSLSNCCPFLKTLTFILEVTHAEVSPRRINQWQYTLDILARAPRTLTTLTIGISIPEGDQALVDSVTTLDIVNWKEWNEVLGEFSRLACVWFRRADSSVGEWKMRPAEPSKPLPELLAEKMRLLLNEELPRISEGGVLRVN